MTDEHKKELDRLGKLGVYINIVYDTEFHSWNVHVGTSVSSYGEQDLEVAVAQAIGHIHKVAREILER